MWLGVVGMSMWVVHMVQVLYLTGRVVRYV